VLFLRGKGVLIPIDGDRVYLNLEDIRKTSSGNQGDVTIAFITTLNSPNKLCKLVNLGKILKLATLRETVL
jgi:hypothetical protein